MALPKPFKRASTGEAIGIDRGVARTVSSSDGTHSKIPSLGPQEQTRFLALERRLARQVKGSNRRAATRRALNVLHETLTRRRTDWVEKITTGLVGNYDHIAIGRLDVSRMVKSPAPRPDPDRVGSFMPNGARAKARLDRAILASCSGLLARRLKDKASACNPEALVLVKEVEPKFTSLACHRCGHISKENRKSQFTLCCHCRPPLRTNCNSGSSAPGSCRTLDSRTVVPRV